MAALLDVRSIDEAPADWLRRHGRVVQEFSHLTQDSGNVSWLLDTDTGPVFVKTAGLDAPPPPGAPTPFFHHDGRVQLLRNAVTVACSCSHPALPALLNVIESPSGPLLVYEAADGDPIGVPNAQRTDPSSAYRRFATMTPAHRLEAFDVLIDLHRSLAAAGWIACDLYDSSLIVDFATTRLRVIDLDSYHRGPVVNTMGRMFGSDRFMAPEEHQLGATIDEATTVFTLGRLVWHFGTGLTEDDQDFCGPADLAAVVQRATRPSPAKRYPTVAAFADAWQSKR